MTLGTDIRSQLNSVLFDNPNIRSTATRTPVSEGTSSDGGYSGTARTEETAVTLYCVPTSYASSITSLAKLGDLRIGDLRIFVKGTETVNKGDKITLNSENFTVRKIEPIFFNDITVAQGIVLSRKL